MVRHRQELLVCQFAYRVIACVVAMAAALIAPLGDVPLEVEFSVYRGLVVNIGRKFIGKR